MNIGEYKILKVLGRGGYGFVYEGSKGGEHVAIKVPINPSFNFDLIIEGKALLTLEKNCPNKTPKFIESFFIQQNGKKAKGEMYSHIQKDTDNLFVLVIELIQGHNLFFYMQRYRHKLSTGVRVSLVLQVLRDIVPVLECVSIMGYAHNDIKLENIMVKGRGGKVKMSLVDFGIWCKLLPKNSPECSSIDIRCCENNGVKGSYHYVSPEEVDYGRSFETSDIWSLGVVCYEILHDEYPSDMEIGEEGKISVFFYDRPKVSLIDYGASNNRVVKFVNEIVTRMLILDPMKRIGLRGISEYMRKNKEAINRYIEGTTTLLPDEIDLMLPPDANYAILSEKI